MLNRRRFLLGTSLAAMVVASPALAWPVHGIAGPTGTAILNGFNSVQNGDYPYKNMLLGAPQFSNQSGTAPWQTSLDANGYPNTTLGAQLNCGQVPIPPSWAGDWIVGWTGKNSFNFVGGGATPRFAITADTGPTVPNVQGAVTFNLTIQGTSGRVKFNFAGQARGNNIPLSFISGFAFDGSLGGMYLCRDNGVDEADILSGDINRMFNNDFIASLIALNPYAIRVMDFANTNNSNVSKPYSLRRPVASFSFGTTETTGVGSHWPASAWGGAITGTLDTFSASASSGTPATPTHGETWQGQFGASASNTVYAFSSAATSGGKIQLVLTAPASPALVTGQTIAVAQNVFASGARGNWVITVLDSTHVELTTNLVTGQPSVFSVTTSGNFSTMTLDIKAPGGASRGAQIVNWGTNGGGAPIFSSAAIVANEMTTVTWDADLKAWLLSPGGTGLGGSTAGGLTAGPPIEVLVALANKVNTGLWYCYPQNVINSEITAIAAYMNSNLRSTSPGFHEWGNEVWNGQFGNSGLATTKGLLMSNASAGAAAAFQEGSNRALFGYYALRVVQTMNLVKAAMPRARCVMANQAFAGTGLTQVANVYRLQGTDLTPAGNAVYAASSISGGINYTAAGSRPIDACTDLAYATYYSGAQCANADPNYSSLSGITGSTNLLGQAANFVAGGATNIANALAFLDNDIRQGTLNGVAGSETLLALNTGYTGGGAPFGIYPGWENICTSYDSSRIANGLPLLQVSCYEGGCQIWPVTAAQLSALGDGGNSATDAANVLALITGYKNSALFKQLVLDQFNQFMNTAAISPSLVNHSKHPCWYTFGSGSQWALNSGDLYSTPFQSYNAFKQFNGH